MNQFKIIRNTRTLVERAIDGLTTEQLLAIPTGSRNNILWNVGHLVVTQQILHYRLAGLPLLIPDELVEQFRAGSSPAEWTETPDIGVVRNYMVSLPDQLETDYAAGKFSNHQGFTTKSTGMELPTIEDVIDFVVFHDGLHLGVIQAYRKLVS